MNGFCNSLIPTWLIVAFLTGGCGSTGQGGGAPSDDPADYRIDTSIDYEIQLSDFRWVVPSEDLPPRVEPFASNANVDIHFFEDRLFMAWRSAPFHFASTETLMFLISSLDGGHTWEHEHTFALTSDVREPRFLTTEGDLQLMFFQGGTDPLAFEPQRIWHSFRRGLHDWTAEEVMLDEPEVPWDVKRRSGRAWMTSYKGEHYSTSEDATVDAFFKVSDDGLTWSLVGGAEFVYRGGVSEVAFEFDADGSLWAVTRNEDGDETGFGSHVCVAPAGDLSAWECPSHSDPERYDSPELFRHGDDLYLVARRDVGGPFDMGDTELTLVEQRSKYLREYSLRPKRTALYRIDKATRAVVHIMDLPGAGDTAFPSVRRTGPHTFLLANYTSPLDDLDITWLQGQTSSLGTQLYFQEIVFVPGGK